MVHLRVCSAENYDSLHVLVENYCKHRLSLRAAGNAAWLSGLLRDARRLKLNRAVRQAPAAQHSGLQVSSFVQKCQSARRLLGCGRSQGRLAALTCARMRVVHANMLMVFLGYGG